MSQKKFVHALTWSEYLCSFNRPLKLNLVFKVSKWDVTLNRLMSI